MKYGILVYISIVVLFAAFSSPVYAQYETNDRTRLGLGFSLFRPTGGELRALQGYWISPRLDFHFTYDKQDRPQTMLSISWFSASNATANGKMVPIVASYVKHLSPNEDKSPYVGAGVAAYNTVYRQFVPFVGSAEASGWKFGTTWFAGYDYGSWFIEARYNQVSHLALANAGSVDFSGVTLTVGTHFGL